VKDRKEKEQYSMNFPLEVIKKLQLEDSWVELVVGVDFITIKKIGETQNEKQEHTEGTNRKPDIF